LGLLGERFWIGCCGLNWGAAGEIDDAKVGAVFVPRETDGGDPGGALVDEEGEEDQVQRDGGGSITGVALGGCDGFAYGFYVGVPSS
jgi:hypothetical protein